jgi:hypothetical protein
MIDKRKLIDFLNKYAEQDFQLPERASPYNDIGVDGYQFGFADGMTELARNVVSLLDNGAFNYPTISTTGSTTSLARGPSSTTPSECLKYDVDPNT